MLDATPVSWWHRDPTRDHGVVCTLCPRHCRIGSGQRGFCYVRANVDGALVLTTYGRSSGLCIDPIEKKPLYHYLPGSATLSLGTAGCNLGCRFCQNWDISTSRDHHTLAAAASPEAIAQAAAAAGCRSVAFTYNDPVIWAEYAIDIARAAHAVDLAAIAVTAGYIEPDARRAFFTHIDAANVDLKAWDEVFYRRMTLGDLEPVRQTLVYLARETDVWLELTHLLIPGHNDDPEATRRMCGWILTELGADVPIHFSAFHPSHRLLDVPRTPAATLWRAYEIAQEEGLHYVYVGNISDPARESTWCPGCGELLIERNRFDIGRYHVHHSACASCLRPLPGRFDARPGNWGSRRQPLQIVNR
jgi:pyruvate formate lyase activating enzyme